ncbi:hypothetical protein SGLAM104S_04746 [Streptomyces glaucescens]
MTVRKGVAEIAQPILDDVMNGGRPDVISIGFLFALWSGSRAVNVFIDTITVMYGLDGVRGIVKTRLMAFLLFIVALLIGSVALPLMVAGPDAVVRILPWSTTVVQVLYWPVVIVLSIVFLTTLYHVSVPVRSPWIEDVPGALVALAMWVLGSFLLRIYLTNTIEGATIYGSLAAAVAVLLWIGWLAAVLVGSAVTRRPPDPGLLRPAVGRAGGRPGTPDRDGHGPRRRLDLPPRPRLAGAARPPATGHRPRPRPVPCADRPRHGTRRR